MVRKDKRLIAKGIIHEIHQSGGRFLIEDPSITAGLREGTQDFDETVHPSILVREWARVGTDKALAKVMHRLRDKNRANVATTAAAVAAANVSQEGHQLVTEENVVQEQDSSKSSPMLEEATSIEATSLEATSSQCTIEGCENDISKGGMCRKQ